MPQKAGNIAKQRHSQGFCLKVTSCQSKTIKFIKHCILDQDDLLTTQKIPGVLA
eukprot:TRINITY_DN6161_c1_g1_i1.p2 TRINITY_DN6161_c1_g1~~TRINITY_DN6161_c1_g1_i1.p2  ORF type:complete len:54 (-),score=0.27 TRINITY_DN6161_c1_g1_i1:97-258(-)